MNAVLSEKGQDTIPKAIWDDLGLVAGSVLDFSELGRPSLRQAAMVFAGIVLLCGSSLLGVIYSFFFGLAFLAIWLGRESFPASLRRPGLWILVLPAAVVLAGLATYYFWTLQVGARASGVGKTNAMSMAFCAYELLGFTGAGPGRAALRENPIGALRPFIFPIALYGGILAVFLVASLKNICGQFSAAPGEPPFCPAFPLGLMPRS